jgi:glycyl-tRNA synthetase beta chain
MTAQNLLVELFVEELPPKALKKLGDAFATVLANSLKAQGLAPADAAVTAYASPRRLGAHVVDVLARAADKPVSQKLMPVSVGLDASGQPTPALLKRLAGLGADASAVPGLRRAMDGKAEALFFDSVEKGISLTLGLAKALQESLDRLPIPKVMTYQLEEGCELPGWDSVQFVRPVHGLLALHGADVVQIEKFGLKARNTTHGHRFEAAMDPVVIPNADVYAATMARDGAVIASFEERRAEIARQLTAAAAKVGGGCRPIEDDALLDEVTALVERPNVLVCEFESQFLDVPQECLILTMKANQKYFPLLDAQGRLTNKFLVVSNISPADASAVIGGNERVVRPRLADAKFFFDQDRKRTLESRVEGLGKVVYHNQLGTQGERMERVRAIARAIGQQLGGDVLAKQADTAARLAKTDLLTDMVGEFPELQGIMGGYYARHDGLSEDIAFAIEDHYKPRFAGDALPRNAVGMVVALADKLETLAGMFGIGNLPSGDKDPFALRRHALGVVRILMEHELKIPLGDLLNAAINEGFARRFSEGVQLQTFTALHGFFVDRLSGYLQEQGFSVQLVSSIQFVASTLLTEVPKRLEAVRTFASLPEAPALAAANKRIGNILKKSEGVGEAVNASMFQEPAEQALFDAMQATVPAADAKFEAGDFTASLQALAALRAPVDAFFDGVMVNADDPALKANRLALLQQLHRAMNRVADLSRLAA